MGLTVVETILDGWTHQVRHALRMGEGSHAGDLG